MSAGIGGDERSTFPGAAFPLEPGELRKRHRTTSGGGHEAHPRGRQIGVRRVGPNEDVGGPRFFSQDHVAHERLPRAEENRVAGLRGIDRLLEAGVSAAARADPEGRRVGETRRGEAGSERPDCEPEMMHVDVPPGGRSTCGSKPVGTCAATGRGAALRGARQLPWRGEGVSSSRPSTGRAFWRVQKRN